MLIFDWTGCNNDRKSSSGYIIKLFGNTVIWSTRKQQSVSLSSAEAEYIALSQASCEIRWIQQILQEMGLNKDKQPSIVYEDNKSCINIANNAMNPKRLKHIDIRFHHVKDLIEKKYIYLEYIPTEQQQADILTKPLPKDVFLKLKKAGGLEVNFPYSELFFNNTALHM